MTDNTSHDIDDILLEQQEQNQDFNSEFESGGKGDGNGHDDDNEEEFKTPIAEKEDKYKDEDENASDRNGKIQSAADVLVELATQNAKLLFKDQYGTAYAQVDTTGHDEIIKVEGSK